MVQGLDSRPVSSMPGGGQAGCQALVNAALDKYGQLDSAFNNAGIGGESNPIADTGAYYPK